MHVRPGAERERSELRIGVLLKGGRKAKSRKRPKEIAQIYGKLSKARQAKIERREKPEKAKALANADESAAIESPKANARETRFALLASARRRDVRKRPKELTQNHRKLRRKSQKKYRKKKIGGKFLAEPIRPPLN